ncbi:hypothetical protein WJX79_004897 [Trebouxia sp. C0005]
MQNCPGVSGRQCVHHHYTPFGTSFLPAFQPSHVPHIQRPLPASSPLQIVTSRFGGDGGGAAGPSRPSRPSAPSRGGGGGRGGGRGGGGNQGSRPPMRGGYGGGNRGNSNGSNRGRGGIRNAPEPRVIANRMIQADQVRLLSENKDMLGVMFLDEAMDAAESEGLDVVLVSPDADPPVCRLMDASKHKYELEKQDKESKKKQREARQDVKELKVRPGTDVHDYEVRLRAAQKFLAKGDKVKFSLQFRGREMQFQEEGSKMFQRFMADLKDDALIESQPSMQGRTMYMIMAPQKP